MSSNREGEQELLQIDDGDSLTDDEMITEYYTSSDESDSYFSSKGSVYTYDSSEYSDLSTIYEETSADLNFESSQDTMALGDSDHEEHHQQSQNSIRIVFAEDENEWRRRFFPGRKSHIFDDNVKSQTKVGDVNVSEKNQINNQSKLELALESIPKQSTHGLDASVSERSSHSELQKSNSIVSKITCATYPLSDEEEECEESSRDESLCPSLVSSVGDDFSFGSSSISEDKSPLYAKRGLRIGASDTTMHTIDESSEMIAVASINMRQSRHELSYRLEKINQKHSSLPPNLWSTALQSPPSYPKTHIMCRRLNLEKWSGDRRRKAYAKSKYMLSSNIFRSQNAFNSPSKISWMGCEASIPSFHLLASLGGLERRRSFAQAKHQIQAFFEKKERAQQGTQRRSPPQRSLSLLAIPSPPVWTSKKSSRCTERASLIDRQSQVNLALVTRERSKPSLEIPLDRRLYLKYRLQIERYSGERRRRHFERTKGIIATELEAILQRHKSSIERKNLRHLQKRPRSRKGSCQKRPASGSKEPAVACFCQKSYTKPQKMFAARNGPFVAWSPYGPPKKPLALRNIVTLQRQKSYKKTREIFQRSEPFVAWRLKECEEGHKSNKR
jgi:hypothetical protein